MLLSHLKFPQLEYLVDYIAVRVEWRVREREREKVRVRVSKRERWGYSNIVYTNATRFSERATATVGWKLRESFVEMNSRPGRFSPPPGPPISLSTLPLSYPMSLSLVPVWYIRVHPHTYRLFTWSVYTWNTCTDKRADAICFEEIGEVKEEITQWNFQEGW